MPLNIHWLLGSCETGTIIFAYFYKYNTFTLTVDLHVKLYILTCDVICKKLERQTDGYLGGEILAKFIPIKFIFIKLGITCKLFQIWNIF